MLDAAVKRQGYGARAVLAAIVACLLVLQVILTIGASPSRSAHATGVVAMDTDHCENGGAHPGSSHNHRQHSDCCIVCTAQSRDAAVLFAIILFALTIVLAPLGLVSRLRRATISRGAPPLGWATSWSSRAPPQAA